VAKSVVPPLRTALAFGPGHVTGMFDPSTRARDPRARGSFGAGVVLSAGVVAEAVWRSSGARRIRIDSDVRIPLDISADAARRLFATHTGELRLTLRHQLPVGQGFGSSAAGALATALAVAKVTGATRTKAIEVAHLADLFGGGGLGGVAAILGGGLEVRTRPGIPPFGRVVRAAFPDPVLVGVSGAPIPTSSVLRDPRLLARIHSASGGLATLGANPEVSRFWDASESFSDRVGLAPPELRALIRGLRRRGARAAQAMFGGSFFATLPPGRRRRETLDWLDRQGVRAVELTADTHGARLLGSGPRSGSGPYTPA
jgi:pantoate kinase